MGITPPGLYGETLPAATLGRYVRIAKLQPLVEALANKVQLRAVKVGHAFGIYEHLDAMILEYLVLGGLLIDKLQDVGHPGTAGSGNTQANTQSLATAGQLPCHMFRRGLCEGYRHISLRSAYPAGP